MQYIAIALIAYLIIRFILTYLNKSKQTKNADADYQKALEEFVADPFSPDSQKKLKTAAFAYYLLPISVGNFETKRRIETFYPDKSKPIEKMLTEKIEEDLNHQDGHVYGVVVRPNALFVLRDDISQDQILRYCEENDLDIIVKDLNQYFGQAVKAQASEEAPICGDSKFGGCPDLPSVLSWPESENGPMNFVAQINLAQMEGACEGFPEKGMLYFFYDEHNQPWGYDPKDAESFRVLFSDGEETLTPAQASAEIKQYPVKKIEPHKVYDLQPTESPAVRKADLFSKEKAAYGMLYNLLQRLKEKPDEKLHQIGGTAAPLKEEVERDCQLASNGVYCGSDEDYQTEEAGNLLENMPVWRLLLQVDSDESMGMMWSDNGRLYFMITEENLRSKNFDKAWVVLQCH